MDTAAPPGSGQAPGHDARAAVTVDLEPAGPDGRAVVRLRTEAGAWITLHHASDPLAEAHAQLDHAAVEVSDVLVVVGAGLGYLTEAAHARWPEATIVVVEPLAALAEASRARTPGLYSSGRVRAIAGPDYLGAGELWRAFDTPRSTGATPPVVAHPVLGRAVPTLMSEAARVVGRAVAAARMNAQARARHAGRYVTNTLRNLRHVVDGANPDRLRGQFAGIPAVVVGAGPSLDQNLDDLRAVGHRALVVATDTAWRPLVRAGVSPHLVVALDPSPENGKHLMGVAAAADTWIVAEGSVDPEALRRLTGRVATFRVAAHHPWPWLQHLGVDRPVLRAWGSVLTSAFDLALECGCDPIVFVGADLGFTDGRPYCRGTSMEDGWARHAAGGVSLRQVWRNTVAARPLVTETGVTGEGVLTSPHLVEFRNWLVARAGETASGRVVNATGAGILVGPGVRQAALMDVLAPYADCDDAVRATLRTRLNARHDAARCRAMSDALSVVALTEEGTGPPVAEWVAFGRPTLTPADIQQAVLDGRDALTTDLSPPPGPSAVALRWHAADRVAAMRARLTGDPSGLEGSAPPWARRSADAVADATRLIDALLELPVVAASVRRDVVDVAPPHTVPLSCRFVWTEEAAPLVAGLEEALLDAGVPAVHVVRPLGDDYWTEPITPVVVSADGAAVPAEATDRAARSAILVERLALTGEGAAVGAGATTRAWRVVAAAVRGLAEPALAAPASRALDVRTGAGSTRVPIVVDALMRALTGTIVVAVAEAGGDPRAAFLAGGIAHIEPTSLTGRGLPRGWGVAPAEDERATFVSARALHSVRLAPDGDVETGIDWPGPITSQMPWGPDGGALAWNSIDDTAFWRSHGGAAPEQATPSFKPMHLATAPDGEPYWTDASGNVWQWTPGRQAIRVATLPAAGIPRFEGAQLIVTPMPRDEQLRLVRQRLPYEWRVDRATGASEPIATGPEGQCAEVARQGTWTARSHPYADLIRLDRPGAGPVWLACYQPIGVAWAGASLVVIAGGATVLLFPRLLDRLTALEAGLRLAL